MVLRGLPVPYGPHLQTWHLQGENLNVCSYNTKLEESTSYLSLTSLLYKLIEMLGFFNSFKTLLKYKHRTEEVWLQFLCRSPLQELLSQCGWPMTPATRSDIWTHQKKTPRDMKRVLLPCMWTNSRMSEFFLRKQLILDRAVIKNEIIFSRIQGDVSSTIKHFWSFTLKHPCDVSSNK